MEGYLIFLIWCQYYNWSQLSGRMEFDAVKFYKQTIKLLERPFKENASDQALWKRFLSDLSNKFKLEITFDSKFSDAFRDYFREISQDFAGTETFLSKIKFLSKLNDLAYSNRFISYREYFKISEQIQGIKQCPSNSWLQELSYLRSSESLKEFRSQFLIRFSKLDQQEVQSLLEELDSPQGEQRLKKEYVKFFMKCLEPNINAKVASFVESQWSQWQNKSQMLPQVLINALQKHLGSAVGRNKIQIQINNILVQIAQTNLYQNDRDVQQRLQNQVQLIQKALQKFSGLNIIKQKGLVLHLGKFGSLISGFAGLDADLDLTILTNSYVNELEFLKILYEFLKKEYQEGDRRSSGRSAVPELIPTAKTPLIKVTIRERGKHDITIDIIINNILGIINSKFLKVYAGVRWIKNLGILVKQWAKLPEVNLVCQKNLSSYAMILMLIHYLIKTKKVKAIMDARTRSIEQPHFNFKRMKLNQVEQFDVYYSFKTKSEDVSTIERVNYIKILEGFMKYYAHDIWQQESETSMIITVDQSTDRSIDKETAITIKDPFDKPHNPGRLKIESLQYLKQKFKEGYEILKEAKPERIRQFFGGN